MSPAVPVVDTVPVKILTEPESPADTPPVAITTVPEPDETPPSAVLIEIPPVNFVSDPANPD